MSTIPIPSLDPTSSPPPSQSIKGTVTLIWPYSSSTTQCAFLLADPDFRLRSKKGQVRVKFTGASARAVAEKHVGIGDEVLLGLEGARWGVDEEKGRTPGRSVEGELVFGRRVGLSVRRGGDGAGERVEVDEPVEVAEKRGQRVDVGEGRVEALTPAPRKENELLRRGLGSGSFAADKGWTYSSPAFVKRVRLSEDVPTFDPFGDGELKSPSKDVGKRTSFGTGLRWRYVGRSPSPEKTAFEDVEDGGVVDVEVDVESPLRNARAPSAGVAELEGTSTAEGPEVISIDDLDEEVTALDSPTATAPRLDHAPQPLSKSLSQPSALSQPADSPIKAAQVPSTAMPPPSLPPLSIPSEERKDFAGQPERPEQPATEGPSTPKLGPITSPTLPLPSPFPAETPSAPTVRPSAFKANSLFGALGSAATVIESRRLSGRASQSHLPPPQPASLPPPVRPVVPTPAAAIAEIPASAEAMGPPVQPVESQMPATASTVETINLVDDSDEDVEMIDEGVHAEEAGNRPDQNFSTTLADDDMYDDYERTVSQMLGRDEGIGSQQEQAVDDQMAKQASEGLAEIDKDAPGEEIKAEAGEAHELSRTPKERSSVPTEISEAHEKSPPNELSLDGAAFSRPHRKPSPEKRKPTSTSDKPSGASLAELSTSAQKQSPGPSIGSDHATSQADRERMKKKTFSSLFGLRSPEKEQPSSPEKASSEKRERLSTSDELRTANVQSTTSAQTSSPSQSTGSGQATAQAERERVKKNTFRSLFGMRSPEKEQPPSSKKASPDRQEEKFIPGWFFEVNQQQAQDLERDIYVENAESSLEEVGRDPVVLDDVDRDGDINMLEPLQPEQQDDADAARADMQSPPRKAPTRPSPVEVIELDSSPDVGENDVQDATPKPAAPEMLPSPVVQDLAQHSRDQVPVVSEEDDLAERPRSHTAVQKVGQEDQVQTSPLSSPTADERLSALAGEASAVKAESQQKQDFQNEETSSRQQDDAAISSTTPRASDLSTLEHVVEEHVAPPRITAATNVVELDSSSASEAAPSSPILSVPKPSGQSAEVTPAQSQDEPPRPILGPSYPALPLSPSNSQSLQDMNSQPAVEESVRSRLPPTPQLTQRESSTRTEERLSQRTPASKLLQNESSVGAEVKAAKSPITPQTKTPSRRSARLRPSNVPDVLSEWFSPRSSGMGVDAGKTPSQSEKQALSTAEASHADAALANGATGASAVAEPAVALASSSGFATAHSYFTPLSKVTSLLNPSSQNSHGPNTLDLLAVVSDKTTEPIRAKKKGPKDYYTIFRVTDPSLLSDESFRVEVFRPYKSTLPIAEAGDVMLLRGFVVKSRKRTPYLLSTDSSAWCVWRFPDQRELTKPAWARKAVSWTGSVEEEVKGPPVEFGEEERGHARGLREWWVDLKGEKAKGKDGEAGKQKAAEEVVAKL